MNEYIEIIENWSEKDANAILVRVTKTWGSSPRPVGSLMLINPDGKIAGSVSGGCVEGAVVKSTKDLFNSKGSSKLSYGVSDEDAWSVGLSCGGSIQVFAQSVNFKNDEVWNQLLKNQKENKSSILISKLEDGSNSNSLIHEDGTITGASLSDNILSEANEAYTQRTHRIVEAEDGNYFIQIFPRKSQLLIIGAAHITVDLVSLGNMYGFETIVIDPRGYFAKNIQFETQPSQIIESFPSEVLEEFPLDPYTFCAILSHDPKIDDNALEVLLPSKVGYIGALGSKKTHAKRTKRLLEKGFSESDLEKIHAPIGLSIKARTAREIALSVMGQIIEVKNKYN